MIRIILLDIHKHIKQLQYSRLHADYTQKLRQKQLAYNTDKANLYPFSTGQGIPLEDKFNFETVMTKIFIELGILITKALWFTTFSETDVS